MNLFELTKDLSEAASKHCELVNGVRIKPVGMRYKQTEDSGEDYFEQDVVVSFTRKVRNGDKGFAYLTDNLGIGEHWSKEEKNEYLHLMYNGNTASGVVREGNLFNGQSEETFMNYHTYGLFKNKMVSYLSEEELTIRNPRMVYVPMSKIRDLMKESIPAVEVMLPKDLYHFVHKMLDEMDLFCVSDYRFGLEKSYFCFPLDSLKEYGIKNPCLDKVSE